MLYAALMSFTYPLFFLPVCLVFLGAVHLCLQVGRVCGGRVEACSLGMSFGRGQILISFPHVSFCFLAWWQILYLANRFGGAVNRSKMRDARRTRRDGTLSRKPLAVRPSRRAHLQTRWVHTQTCRRRSSTCCGTPETRRTRCLTVSSQL